MLNDVCVKIGKDEKEITLSPLAERQILNILNREFKDTLNNQKSVVIVLTK